MSEVMHSILSDDLYSVNSTTDLDMCFAVVLCKVFEHVFVNSV